MDDHAARSEHTTTGTRAVVVHESMFGNTRQVAEAIAAGLRDHGAHADAVAVVDVAPADLHDVDLLVLGAPTHTWGLSRASTREGAARAAADSRGALDLEPGARRTGLREWLAELGRVEDLTCEVAVFDTRMHAPFGLSGSAARAARRILRGQGRTPTTSSQHFLVTTKHRLLAGELVRARLWGTALVTRSTRAGHGVA